MLAAEAMKYTVLFINVLSLKGERKGELVIVLSLSLWMHNWLLKDILTCSSGYYGTEEGAANCILVGLMTYSLYD